MLNPILSCIVWAAEMPIYYLFFSRVARRRFPAWRCLLIGFVLWEIGSAGNLLFQNSLPVNYVTTFTITLIFAVSCFQIQLIPAILYDFLLIIMGIVTEFGVIFLLFVFGGQPTDAYNDDLLVLLIVGLMSKTLLMLLCLLLTNFVKTASRFQKIPLIMFLYPVCAVVTSCVFYRSCSVVEITTPIQRLWATVNILLLVSSAIIFCAHLHIMEKELDYAQMEGEFHRLQTEKNYYDILEQQNQQLMLYAHDAKNHLAAIRELNEDPRIDAYVDKLSDQLKSYSSNCHSGNKLLDVMLNKYILECEGKGISLQYDVKSCNFRNVEDIDLVAILGNLMDNAVAASEHSQGKKIILETTLRNKYQVLVITNSCDMPPVQQDDGLMTSKADRRNHGFGLKSVRRTLKKYHGDFNWEYLDDSHEFITTVMLEA